MICELLLPPWHRCVTHGRLTPFRPYQVIFVGAVVNIAKSATNISSNIEDGTGNIDVRQWTETADDDSGKMAGIE